MDLQLDGRTALASGSTAGIGFAIAMALAREGAAVIVSGRTSARVDAAVRAIQERVPAASVRGVAADLATAEGAFNIIAAVPSVDILVNNLGIYQPKPFDQITDEEWPRIFETNVLSGVRLARDYLPQMLSRGWGRIIFISSESAVNIPPDIAAEAVRAAGGGGDRGSIPGQPIGFRRQRRHHPRRRRRRPGGTLSESLCGRCQWFYAALGANRKSDSGSCLMPRRRALPTAYCIDISNRRRTFSSGSTPSARICATAHCQT